MAPRCGTSNIGNTGSIRDGRRYTPSRLGNQRCARETDCLQARARRFQYHGKSLSSSGGWPASSPSSLNNAALAAGLLISDFSAALAKREFR